MNFYTNKNVLITGGTGLIGVHLVKKLQAQGANVTVASLGGASRVGNGVCFKQVDLREMDNCLAVCEGQEIVFHLAGVKGSPKIAVERPASFFVPTVTFNTNMLEAARRSGVKNYLYSSSVGVYAPAEIFYEDDVWKTFPSPHDRFPGWAKRIGELQAEAYQIEYGWDKISIVRPANVYGPYDNFDPINSMVVPSLIKRAVEGENPLTVWSDGSSIRDFIYAEDVANAMMLIVEQGINKPINLGSGIGVSIRELVEVIVSHCYKVPPAIHWDTKALPGDNKRVMDISRARSYGIEPKISLEDGIKETVAWYRASCENVDTQYNPFTEEIKTYGTA